MMIIVQFFKKNVWRQTRTLGLVINFIIEVWCMHGDWISLRPKVLWQYQCSAGWQDLGKTQQSLPLSGHSLVSYCEKIAFCFAQSLKHQVPLTGLFKTTFIVASPKQQSYMEYWYSCVLTIFLILVTNYTVCTYKTTNSSGLQ